MVVVCMEGRGRVHSGDSVVIHKSMCRCRREGQRVYALKCTCTHTRLQTHAHRRRGAAGERDCGRGAHAQEAQRDARRAVLVVLPQVKLFGQPSALGCCQHQEGRIGQWRAARRGAGCVRTCTAHTRTHMCYTHVACTYKMDYSTRHPAMSLGPPDDATCTRLYARSDAQTCTHIPQTHAHLHSLMFHRSKQPLDHCLCSETTSSQLSSLQCRWPACVCPLAPPPPRATNRRTPCSRLHPSQVEGCLGYLLVFKHKYIIANQSADSWPTLGLPHPPVPHLGRACAH